MSSPLFSNLDGLIGLARRGVDVKPTLLRVLTDLYVQTPAHSSDEERQYVELALRLIDAVDGATRRVVAQKLAGYPAAPAEIVRRLGRQGEHGNARDLSHEGKGETWQQEAARAVHTGFARSATDRSPSEGEGADRFTGRHSKDLASKEEDISVKRDHSCSARPRESGNPGLQHHLWIPACAGMNGRNSAESARGAVDPLGPSPDNAVALYQRFFAATAAERREILVKLEDANGPDDIPATENSTEVNRRLEAAVLGGRPSDFIRELERALGILRALAQRIVNDVSGEPLLVAAKALAMPIDVLQRILLFVNPAIGHSIRRVYALSDLYDEFSRACALRLLASWREAASDETRPSSHVRPAAEQGDARDAGAPRRTPGAAAPITNDRLHRTS